MNPGTLPSRRSHAQRYDAQCRPSQYLAGRQFSMGCSAQRAVSVTVISDWLQRGVCPSLHSEYGSEVENGPAAQSPAVTNLHRDGDAKAPTCINLYRPTNINTCRNEPRIDPVLKLVGWLAPSSLPTSTNLKFKRREVSVHTDVTKKSVMSRFGYMSA